MLYILSIEFLSIYLSQVAQNSPLHSNLCWVWRIVCSCPCMLGANNPVLSKKLNFEKCRTGVVFNRDVWNNEVAINVKFLIRWHFKNQWEFTPNMNEIPGMLPIQISSSEYHSESFSHLLIYLPTDWFSVSWWGWGFGNE